MATITITLDKATAATLVAMSSPLPDCAEALTILNALLPALRLAGAMCRDAGRGRLEDHAQRGKRKPPRGGAAVT